MPIEFLFHCFCVSFECRTQFTKKNSDNNEKNYRPNNYKKREKLRKNSNKRYINSVEVFWIESIVCTFLVNMWMLYQPEVSCAIFFSRFFFIWLLVLSSAFISTQHISISLSLAIELNVTKVSYMSHSIISTHKIFANKTNQNCCRDCLIQYFVFLGIQIFRWIMSTFL